MTKVAVKYLKFTKETPNKPWMDKKIVDLIEKQRKNKNVISEKGMSD